MLISRPNLLFVYGTLREGFSNHTLIEKCPKIADATVEGVLMVHGWLPMLFDGEGLVFGEIYEIPEEKWEYVDRLEGHPHWYKRKEVIATSEKDGQEYLVWAYFMDDPHYTGRRMLSGNYRELFGDREAVE